MLLVSLALVIGVILYFQSNFHPELPAAKDESSMRSGTTFAFASTPKLLSPTPFTVQINLKDPTDVQSVTVEFVMPEMKMPENKVAPIMTKPGTYSGSATLTMSGKWLAEVSVHTKSSGILGQTVPFDVP
jgi:hypothetical protein